MIQEINTPYGKVTLSDPEIYINNEEKARSGHMSHALVEYAPGKIIDFNSNCSAKKADGHSTFGYIEYRYSDDGGETYSEANILPYSMEALLDGIFTVSVEKAVCAADGTIVLFILRNFGSVSEPYDTPKVITSRDNGKTWSRPEYFSKYKGRVWDAVCRDGVIYALQGCNPLDCNHPEVNVWGSKPEHIYRLFESRDNGKTWNEVSALPIDYFGRGYGNMVFDETGRLHIYTYNFTDEQNMDHIVSCDLGRTWGEPGACFVNRGIRNPQVALIDGVFVLHCRAERYNGHFLLYTSPNGYTWSEATDIGFKIGAGCYYSNNIVLKNKEGKNRLLIQYSETYAGKCVNVMHRWLSIEK